FASPGGARTTTKTFAVPARLALNQWAIAGDWTIETGHIVGRKPGGRIAYRFHARDLHLVMGPSSRESPVRFRVLVDGKPPGDAHGSDVDAAGNGAATSPRL